MLKLKDILKMPYNQLIGQELVVNGHELGLIVEVESGITTIEKKEKKLKVNVISLKENHSKYKEPIYSFILNKEDKSYHYFVEKYKRAMKKHK